MPDVDLTYVAGTCSVGVGATSVVGVSTLWAQPTNVRQWDLISIDGGPIVPIVASPTDDTHLTIPAWAGTVKAGVTYVIYQVSPLRFVGAQAMTDVETMLAALNTDGWYRYVNPAFAGPTEQGIVANEGQFALKFTTGQLWIMSGGIWVLTGISKPFGVAAPYDNAHTYSLQDIATLSGSSYVYINATPSAGHAPPNATFWAVLASIGVTPWLPAVAWATGVAMVAGPPATLVRINNATYVCLVSHTSGTFATDLAAGKWGLVSASPFLPLAVWATGVAMVAGPPSSYVSNGGSSYVCLVSHTSGTFATDLAAGKWGLVGSIGQGYLATSITSLALSVALKTFGTQAGLAYLPGARIRMSSAANTNNYMEGLVTAYAGTSMTCNITRIAGSGGPYADWNLNCVGDPGAGDLLSTNSLSDVASASAARVNLGVPPVGALKPGGRLTLVSGVAVMTADQVGASNLFYSLSENPYVPLYDGTKVAAYQFTSSNTDTVGLTLNLASSANWAAGTLFDAFVTLKSGVPTLVTGPQWSSSAFGSSSRGYANPVPFAGVDTNAAAMTVRDTASSTFTMAANQGVWVGTILIGSTAGQIDVLFGTAAAGGGRARSAIWNRYNQTPGSFCVMDTNSAWNPTTVSTFEPFDNSLANRISFVDGLANSPIDAAISAVIVTPAGKSANVGIALNNITTVSSRAPIFGVGSASANQQTGSARGLLYGTIGLNYIQAMQFGGDAGVAFATGSPTNQALTAEWWW